MAGLIDLHNAYEDKSFDRGVFKPCGPKTFSSKSKIIARIAFYQNCVVDSVVKTIFKRANERARS